MPRKGKKRLAKSRLLRGGNLKKIKNSLAEMNFFWGVGNERKNEKFPKISVIFAFSCVVGSKGEFAALFGKFQNAVV